MRKSRQKFTGGREVDPEVHGDAKKETRRDETKGSVRAFPRCFPFFPPPFFLSFFLSFIRHAIHVSSLRHPRFNLDEVEGWILEGPPACFVFVRRTVRTCPESWRRDKLWGRRIERKIEEKGGWGRGVRRTKNKWEGRRTRLKVLEQRTLYERNWWRDARMNEQNVHHVTLPPPKRSYPVVVPLEASAAVQKSRNLIHGQPPLRWSSRNPPI